MAKDSPSSWFVKDCLDFIANCKSLRRLTSHTRKNQVPHHRSLCIPFLRACFISKPANSKPEQINSNCSVMITWGPASLGQLGGDSKQPHLMRFSFVPALSVLSWLHQEHHHQPSDLQDAKLTLANDHLSPLFFCKGCQVMLIYHIFIEATHIPDKNEITLKRINTSKVEPFITWNCED